MAYTCHQFAQRRLSLFTRKKKKDFGRTVNSVISNFYLQPTGKSERLSTMPLPNLGSTRSPNSRKIKLRTSENTGTGWPNADIVSQEYGKNFSSRELRMRKRNTKTTVPLDAVPERRTKRFPPRFRPVGRFCELRFRYQSSPTGSEGEISRPLDHVWQIPFIHSARFVTSCNFHIYSTAF